MKHTFSIHCEVMKPRFDSVEYPSVETWNTFHGWTSSVDQPANDDEMVDYFVSYAYDQLILCVSLLGKAVSLLGKLTV